VRQPLAEMGRMAVTLLLQMLENERVEGVSVELAIRLVERDSAAPPPLARRGGTGTKAV
jgi:LacI family transcriptional regulator